MSLDGIGARRAWEFVFDPQVEFVDLLLRVRHKNAVRPGQDERRPNPHDGGEKLEGRGMEKLYQRFACRAKISAQHAAAREIETCDQSQKRENETDPDKISRKRAQRAG